MVRLTQDYSQPYNEHNNPPLRVINLDDIPSQHPDFYGNPDHLNAFIELAATPTHSIERGEALRQWKLNNRLAQYDPSSGVQIKGAVEFRGYDLRGADLHNIYLGYIDLRGALLDDANLEGVRMKGAWFDNAHLSNARMTGAFFQFASFAGANLSYTDLRGANLAECKLIEADLSHANLTGALLQDTQHRGWNLSNTTCYSVYWDKEQAARQYAPGEFEELFSEERLVEFSVDGNIHSHTIASVSEMIQAFKKYKSTDLNLTGVENINGVNRFSFSVKKQSDESTHNIQTLINGVQELVSKLNPAVDNITVIQNIGQFIQTGTVNMQDNPSANGVQAMAHFNNSFNINSVGQINQAHVINNPVYNDTPVSKETAEQLMKIVETKEAEKGGFTEDIKQEIKSALTDLLKEETRTLVGKAYGLLREFFPSYIKPFFPKPD